MYCKLFASLYQGTLRGRSNEILVFTNLLAHAAKDGTVDKHWRAISEETGLTVEEVKAAIAVLEAPDEESRSPEYGGARIVKMDGHRAWGWLIVNYAKYRAIRSEEDRAEQNRLAQQRWRDKNKPASAAVSHDKPASAESKQDKPKERERDKQRERERERETPLLPPTPPDGDSKPSASRGGDEARLPTSEAAIRIANLYHRRLTTPWSPKEIKAFKALGKIDLADLALVESYTKDQMSKPKGFHRRDILTFLNNFHGETDRARAWKARGSGASGIRENITPNIITCDDE